MPLTEFCRCVPAGLTLQARVQFWWFSLLILSLTAALQIIQRMKG